MEGNMVTLTGELSTIYARDGESAYEIAVNNGFDGTEEEWLASLKGDKDVYSKTETNTEIANAVNGHNVVTFDDAYPTKHQITARKSGERYDLYSNAEGAPTLLAEAPATQEQYNANPTSTRPVSCDVFTTVFTTELNKQQTKTDAAIKTCSDVLISTVAGKNIVPVTDLSTVNPSISVYLTSDTRTDFSGVKVKQYGSNLIDANILYAPENNSVVGDLKIEYTNGKFKLNGTSAKGTNAKQYFCKYPFPSVKGERYVCSVAHTGGTYMLPEDATGTPQVFFGASDTTEGTPPNWLSVSLYGGTNQAELKNEYIAGMWFILPNGITFYDYEVEIQLELGRTANTFTPNNGWITHTADANGQIDNVNGLYSATFTTDAEDVTINCVYTKDITKYTERIRKDVDVLDVVVSEQHAPKIDANIIKGKSSATSTLMLSDVHPVKHNLSINVSNKSDVAEPITDFKKAGVKVTRYGTNLLDGNLRSDKFEQQYDVVDPGGSVNKKTFTIQYLPDEDVYEFNGTVPETKSYYIKNHKDSPVVPVVKDGEYIALTVPVSGSWTPNPKGNTPSIVFVQGSDYSAAYGNNWLGCGLQGTTSKTAILTNNCIHNSWFYLHEGTKFENYKVRIKLQDKNMSTEYQPYVKPVTKNANKAGVVTGLTSIHPVTILEVTANTVSPNNIVINCDYNRDINKYLEDYTVVKKLIPQVSANTLTNKKSGVTAVAINDISPAEHTLGVRLSGEAGVVLDGVQVTRHGTNLLNGNLRTEPKTEGGVTVQYIPEEDVYLFSGQSTTATYVYCTTHNSTDKNSYSLIPSIKGSKYTLTVSKVSGGFSNESGVSMVAYLCQSDTLNNTPDTTKSFWFNCHLGGGQASEVLTKNYINESFFFIKAGVTFNDYKVRIQLEAGDTATECQPYVKPITNNATSNGQVTGLTSVYPTTVLTTNTEGVTITCDYNRDINKAFAELEKAILNLGNT